MTTPGSTTAVSQGDTNPGLGTPAPAVFQTGSVLSLGLTHAVNDTYMSFLAPLLPPLITKLALSKTEAGLIAFLSTSPSLLQPVIGYLADRSNMRYLVILSPALAATAMSLLGVAPSAAVLALMVAVAGLASAALHAVATAMTGHLSGDRLGRGIGVWMVGGTLGFTIGPVIIVVALKLLTLEGIPWLMLGGWAASAILFACLRQVSTPPLHTTDSGTWRDGLRSMRPILVPVAGITLLRGMLIPATFTFLPTYLTEQGMDLWFAGLAVSICAGAGMVGSLVGGSLSDRWGRRSVLSAFLIATPFFVFALLAVRGWALLPVLVALGIVIPPAQVILLALVQETSTSNRAYATGLYLSLAFLSEAAGSVAVGVLGDLLGLRLAIAISAAILAPTLPLVLLLPGRQTVARETLS